MDVFRYRFAFQKRRPEINIKLQTNQPHVMHLQRVCIDSTPMSYLYLRWTPASRTGRFCEGVFDNRSHPHFETCLKSTTNTTYLSTYALLTIAKHLSLYSTVQFGELYQSKERTKTISIYWRKYTTKVTLELK